MRKLVTIGGGRSQRRNGLAWSDVTVLLLLPVIGVLLSVYFRVPYLVSILLFYGVPGIYLAIRRDKPWQVGKAFLFSSIVSIPFTVIVDVIGTRSGVWYAPHTLFPSRFLGIIPYEDFIWMFAAVFVIMLVFETFLDKGKREFADQRMWSFVCAAFLVLGIFFFLLFSGGEGAFAFKSNLTYLFLGILFFLLPALVFLLKFPQFVRRAVPLAGYFFYVTLLFELTATFLDQWVFTGTYLIPPLNLFGNSPVAFEELFFVGIVGPLAAVALYEFFDDDRK